MAETLAVSVISPERVLFEGTAKSVVIPAHDGEMGILSAHAPLMTILGRGVMRVQTGEREIQFSIEGGFLQVVENQIRVVTEAASEL